ncbi:MAG: ABC transporter ATP-binding protein [Methanobacteriaceae archaeon]
MNTVVTNPIFETKNLIFNNDINYDNIKITRNICTFIVGKSGTGKTSLLKLFNGTLIPNNGEIYYNSTNINDIDIIKLRKEVSLISQEVFLFDKSIKENFKEFYDYMEEELISDDSIKSFLDICSIDFPLDTYCSKMSGGEKQRVYTAIYLSFIPKILLLDEPTSALDKENKYNLIENIIEFGKSKNITIVIVSHDNDIINKFADEIIRIK